MSVRVKETARQLIDDLPEDVTWDEIQYRLYLRQVIDESESQIAEKQGLPQSEAEERLSQWLK